MGQDLVSAGHTNLLTVLDSLDYSQMTPNILYGYCGLLPQMEDCYHIKGYEYCRKGIKKVFNAMTFSDGPITRFPKGINSLFPVKTRFKEVADAIENAHSRIAHLFYTGIGHYLQFLESQILVEVLLKLIDKGITALPIHDAVLVSEIHVYKSKQVMEQVFLDMTKEALPTTTASCIGKACIPSSLSSKKAF